MTFASFKQSTIPRMHLIDRQIITLDYRGSSREAEAVQEQLRQLLTEEVNPALERLFDQYAGTGTVLRLDRLEVELPPFTPGELSRSWVQAVVDSCESALRQATGQGSTERDAFAAAQPEGETPEAETLTLAQAHLRSLRHFLRHGSLPWWARPVAWAELERASLAALEASTVAQSALRSLLQGSAPARERLRQHATPAHWPRWVSALWPETASLLLLGEAALSRWLNEAEGPIRPSGLARQVRGWVSEPEQWAQTSAAQRYPQMLRVALSAELWQAETTEALTLWQRLLAQMDALASGAEQAAFWQAMRSWRDAQLLPRLEKRFGRSSGWAEWLDTPESGQTSSAEHPGEDSSVQPVSSPSEAGGDLPQDESPSSETEADSASPSLPWDDFPLGLSDLPPGVQILVHGQAIGGNEASDPPLAKSPLDAGEELPPPPLFPRQDLPVGTEIAVYQAGLVLLHPFLPTYLAAVGLTRARAFVDEAAQAQALSLLAYLATGQTDAPEYDLVLPKLLCGWPLAQPVPLWETLPAKALAEGDHLLQTALDHWGALGRVGPDSLREGFLQRPGKLRRHDHGWQLHVEPQTLDVLLDRLPWGLSTVYFPWMEGVLTVYWR